MNEPNLVQPPRRESRRDVVALWLSLLAVAIAIHCRLFPNWPRAEAKSDPIESVNERLQAIERSLGEVQATLGVADKQGRSVADRLLVAENQNLLFDETLGKIVAHVKTIEETARNAR